MTDTPTFSADPAELILGIVIYFVDDGDVSYGTGTLIGNDKNPNRTFVFSCYDTHYIGISGKKGRVGLTNDNKNWREYSRWNFTSTWGYIQGKNSGLPVLRVFGGDFIVLPN
jgi:hypothetical protein